MYLSTYQGTIRKWRTFLRRSSTGCRSATSSTTKSLYVQQRHRESMRVTARDVEKKVDSLDVEKKVGSFVTIIGKRLLLVTIMVNRLLLLNGRRMTRKAMWCMTLDRVSVMHCSHRSHSHPKNTFRLQSARSCTAVFLALTKSHWTTCATFRATANRQTLVQCAYV